VAEPPRRFSAAIYSVLKDLALPVLLGILAFGFQHSLQERARAQAVRQALIPRATENVVRYLLPIVSAVSSLQKAVTNGETTAAFFYLVFVLKRMRDLTTAGGGIVLGNLASERFPMDCWGIFFARMKQRYGYMDLSHTMDLMTDHESISQFCTALLDAPEATRAVRTAAVLRFQQEYLKDFAKENFGSQLLLPILQIMAKVFEVEGNWLHRGWYEDEELNEELKVPTDKWRLTITNADLGAKAKLLLESITKYETVLLKRQLWYRRLWIKLRSAAMRPKSSPAREL
jgi:hypothetical protein